MEKKQGIQTEFFYYQNKILLKYRFNIENRKLYTNFQKEKNQKLYIGGEK